MRRKKPSVSALEQYRAEWRKSHRKRALQKALAHCRDHRLPEPAWLHEAIYQLGRAQVGGMRKTGRKTDLMSDDLLYASVQEYIEDGYKQEKACELTATLYNKELRAKSRTGKGKSRDDYLVTTVMKAWLRHKKRIAFDHIPVSWGGSGWRIKDEYKKNDRNAKEFERMQKEMRDLPAYLKPELT
jgi:hypothetical protein